MQTARSQLSWGCVVLSVALVSCVAGQNTTTSEPTTGTTEATTSGSSPTTATPSIDEVCATHNGTCENCVSNSKCLWCSSKSQKCIPYPVGDILPGKDTCPLGDARWGTCLVNYEVLLISMGVIGSLLLIGTCCCVYCCCCRTNKEKQRKKYQKEEFKVEAERQERQARSDERKNERKAKHDEIRQKYGLTQKGLVKDSNPYQRFDS